MEITYGGTLMKVEVNSSATAAEKLDTVQTVVAWGRYANTILVASGGTLKPTDRWTHTRQRPGSSTSLPDAFSLPICRQVPTSSRSSTPVTTVSEFIPTPIQHGLLHSLRGTLLTDAGAAVVADAMLNAVASAWEYTYYGQSARTTAPGKMGNIHGREAEISLPMSVDGSPSTRADGAGVDGTREIVVTRVSQLRHTQLGTTAVADVITRTGRIVAASRSMC